MDETVIVIMLKDSQTGFLEKELGCYALQENEELIYNTYAAANEHGGFTVYIKLTVERDVSDWEYNAIFDYYDTEALLPLVDTVRLDTEQYNPTWLVSFPFVDNIQAMEEKLCAILLAHKQELVSVYEAIADKKDDYIDENN